MEYYELAVTVYLLGDINFDEATYAIGQVINQSFYLDLELSKKHEVNEFKLYSFNNLYPLESDKIYKKGRIYIFKIRSLRKDFILKVKELLPKAENNYMKVIAVEQKTIKKRHITELYTMTATLITVDNKHWLPQDDLLLLQERLQANLEKKYKFFYGNSLEVKQSFIQHIEILNHKPVSIKYKNTKLLGNKFKIIPNDDEISQILAFIAEATGIGEKSSAAGLGYINAQYLK
jgi:CRISPR-associated endoribonuclease Cas6